METTQRIQIPTGMSDSQINEYVSIRLQMQRIPKTPEQPKRPQIPTNCKPPLIIPGDDWTTNSKGMQTGTLKRIIKMCRRFEAEGKMIRTKFY